jgi:hypothetical protein
MTMEAAELRAALDALGLKQTGEIGLDQFLAVDGTTVRRWARDKEGTPIPESVAMLLRLMIARRLKPATVRKLYGGAEPLQPVIPDSRDAKRRA